jgi:flagellar L-ring protein precursor FlgH
MRLHPVVPLLLGLLAGCSNMERLARVGTGPELDPVTNPTQDPRWRPVSMPTPQPHDPSGVTNSLWRPGSRTFLRDQRAASVGDLVTVLVSIADQAQLQNSTSRARDNSENFGFPQLFGFQSSYARIFPNVIQPDRLVEASSTSGTANEGQVRRGEVVTLRVAATVAQVLPNGNLSVVGRQQVRVNHELRELSVAGVIRPQDIASDNTVRHDRLAEARISYGGRGTLSDVQRPRWGQEILDAILPF